MSGEGERGRPGQTRSIFAIPVIMSVMNVKRGDGYRGVRKVWRKYEVV